MKAFHTIAIPHKDILEGRLTMDIFAADLWEAYQNRGPAEYKDAGTFFQKTYMTEGLQNLLTIIQKRIEGKGGDPVIQIQTPFGGGKTHSLIAMMHKAHEWKAKIAVIVGTNLEAKETLWALLEKQLTGKNETLTGLTSPGKTKLKKLLEKYQPAVILMDEVLEYVTKAAGVKVENSNLASQTMAFMQELTETVSVLEKVSLVVTLPASIIEHYDESAEKFFTQLQKVVGRMEKIYTPVQEWEIAQVIRQRLFSSVNANETKNIVNSFMNIAEKEGILPQGIEPTEYRNRFLTSYPFMPEVIDVLYHRWGSFPNFQRTRGVLRLLSLVIFDQRNSNIPYITLADFNLSNQEIRQELLKHIGTEFNSVIAQDITGNDAGSKKVDNGLGDAYKGLKIATRAATTIFMYSFSGGVEKGATLSEVKRGAMTLNNPASVVAEAVEQLKGKLFYFQHQSDKYFFANQPNLNRIVLTKMENVKDNDIIELERELLKKNLQGNLFKTFIWEENSSNIPDTEELKLIILHREKKEVIEDLIKNKGSNPRVNCNTMLFLLPMENERTGFINSLKKMKAYEGIENDKTLTLTEDQKKEIKNELRKSENLVSESIRRLYRNIAIPTKDGYKTEDLGIPTYGEKNKLDEEVYEKLKNMGEILEQLAPLVIKDRYLVNNNYVSTSSLLKSFYNTPGEMRPTNPEVLVKSIINGVQKGMFGLGELKGENPYCIYFKEHPEVSFGDNEILINDKICTKQKEEKEEKAVTPVNQYPEAGEKIPADSSTESESVPKDVSVQTDISQKFFERVPLSFNIPKGKVSDVTRIITFLQTYFESVHIKIDAKDGKIPAYDYDNKVLEALRQLGIEVETKIDDSE